MKSQHKNENGESGKENESDDTISTTPSMATLVNVLRTQNKTRKSRDWKDYEDHVRNVYQRLLDLERESAIVARDVIIRGRHGQEHQVDVYYEFESAGLRHRVAIECKDHKRPIDKGRVQAFTAVVFDCPGLRGIMVASNGYQSGAKRFAKDNGIIAITADNLPSIGELIGDKLESAVFPSEDDVGQPFWTLFWNSTYEPYATKNENGTYGVLFLSKKDATYYCENLGRNEELVVRGLTQVLLYSYVLVVDACGGKYSICCAMQSDRFMYEAISREILISDYYHGETPLPNVPNVLPGFNTT